MSQSWLCGRFLTSTKLHSTSWKLWLLMKLQPTPHFWYNFKAVFKHLLIDFYFRNLLVPTSNPNLPPTIPLPSALTKTNLWLRFSVLFSRSIASRRMKLVLTSTVSLTLCVVATRNLMSRVQWTLCYLRAWFTWPSIRIMLEILLLKYSS